MIRKINEKLEKFLEKQLSEGNIIPDIIAKYGDLTIPEFISELIKTENNREDILDESLNENLLEDSTNAGNFYFWPKEHLSNARIHGTLSNKLGEMLVKEDNKMFQFRNPFDKSSWEAYRSMLQMNLTHILQSGELHVFVEYKSPAVRKLTASWDVGSNFRYTSEFGQFFEKIRGSRKDEYGFFLGSTLARYTEEGYLEALQDLVEQIITKVKKVDNVIIQKFKKVDMELEELEKARKEAKANRKAATTTVKQALSKSAIAKKIQALQNPTPEQLARILAAIE